jgi:chromate transporter
MIDFFLQHATHYGAIFMHFAGLSLLSVGGVIMLAPAMNQYLVDETRWLTLAQFNAAISISQAAPGPNILFVALMGWYAGMGWFSAAVPAPSAWALGVVGVLTALISLAGMIIPSTLLTYFAARWMLQNQQRLSVQAFKQGVSPIVIAMLIATGYIMSQAHGDWRRDWPAWLLTAGAAFMAWRTQLHLLWLLAIGAAVGAMGLV